LLNNYCFDEDDRILLVTYNKTLVNYFKFLYDKVEEEDQIGYDNLFRPDGDKIDISTMDGLMYKYFTKYNKKKGYKYEINDNGKYDIMAQCIAEMQKKYPTLNLIDQKNKQFLLDEIDWIKACNYLEPEEYQNADRIGRMSNTLEGPQKLPKNSTKREAIFEIMLNYTERMKKLGHIDYKEMALIALEEAKQGVDHRYTHILLDESQDLTRVQLQFLQLIYMGKDYSSLMFIADTAQSIYSHSWLTKGRSFTSIGFDMKGKSNILSKNYRTTTQIAQAAYSLLENDLDIVEDENYVKPSLIDRQGPYPVCKCFKNMQEEAKYIVTEIKDNLISQYRLQDIAIICKNKNQQQAIKDLIEQSGLACTTVDRDNANFVDESIKLLTIHSVKGLEFKVVIISGLNDGVIPYFSYNSIEDHSAQESKDRKLLYVGMTRANELLYLSCSGKPSKFITEINSRYLKLDSGSEMKRFYDIHIESYAFKDKIIDLYSKEEKIRQWIISELKNTYKYPAGLLEIEYKVNNFSQVGSIDLAVCVYNDNRKIPYIFVETKAMGKGIENAIKQLTSYMSNDRNCQYGIATDGNEMIIMNNKFEIIDDIPGFHPSMLPSSIENYRYLDIEHNRDYQLRRDSNNVIDVALQDGSEYVEQTEDSLKELLAYGKIAAGNPIHMEEEINRFYLPTEWLKGRGECYLLRIHGDSMQGANIEDGDYVLIERCQSANNRDIVAVAIEEKATLKRFVPMGDTILLIAENAKYEPIHLKSNQANILGKAIGILKKQ
jgi:DNA helicase-2/ATP-dependent DNA helicase PcrA